MADDFYEFDHECDAMPQNVRFLKIKGFSTSQFTIEQYERGIGSMATTLYGFRFCPYCGEEMDKGAQS